MVHVCCLALSRQCTVVLCRKYKWEFIWGLMNQNHVRKGNKMLRIWWWFSKPNTCVRCPNHLQSSPLYTRGVFLGFGVSLDDRQPRIKQPTLQLIAEPLYHLSYELRAFCHMMTGGRHMHELDICFSLHYMQSTRSTRHELDSRFKDPWTEEHAAMKVTANTLVDNSCVFLHHITTALISLLAGEDTLLSLPVFKRHWWCWRLAFRPSKSVFSICRFVKMSLLQWITWHNLLVTAHRNMTNSYLKATRWPFKPQIQVHL